MAGIREKLNALLSKHKKEREVDTKAVERMRKVQEEAKRASQAR